MSSSTDASMKYALFQMMPNRIQRKNYPVCQRATGPGGGGVLGLEKGTDCGPTAAERWLLRPKMAKKRGAVLLSYCIIGGLSEYLHPIFHIK